MRSQRIVVGSILLFAVMLCLTGCLVAPLVGTMVASHAIGNAMVADITRSDFKFDSVSWMRTPTDTNTLTVRGTLTWNRTRAGVKTTYWNIGPQSPGQYGISVDLADSVGKTMTTVRGTLTVRDGNERITMVPFGKTFPFELHSMQISPNVARAIRSITMKGQVIQTP